MFLFTLLNYNVLSHFICVSIICKLSGATIVLKAEPSRTIPIGKSLTLSCSITYRKLPVMWRKNGADIGEDCKTYTKSGFTCETEKNGGITTYNLKIVSVSPVNAGNWSCAHGLHSVDTVEINVVAPTLVHPLILTPLPNSAGFRPVVHGSSSFQSQPNLPVSGAGTLRHPIDLTAGTPGDGPRDWVVHCKSTCGSSARDLTWELVNKTWLGHVNIPNDPSSSDDCPQGQYRLSQRITFNCLHDVEHSMGKRSKRHSLVGLNRLICAPNHGNLTDLIEASQLPTGAGNSYFRWRRLYPSSLWFSTAAGRGSFHQEEQFDCTSKTGPLPFACLHVLCPGTPTEWFTWGERVALVVSAVLFLMFCVFLCYLTRHRKQAKQRSDIAPGQHHEVELML